MNRVSMILTVGLFTVFVAGAPVTTAQQPAPSFDPSDFQSSISNTFFPISTIRYKVYVGEAMDEETGEIIPIRVEETVLPGTKRVAGVDVTVVEAKDIENGVLIEKTLDYYAQHQDGAVYYFGEDVDDYENGEIVGHGGAWVAGEGDNQPGVLMPVAPAVGDVFQQEQAPGIAEDTTTVLAVNQVVSTRAGQFTGCLRTEDINPLDGAVEYKHYCPGIGFVHEEFDGGQLEVVSLEGGLPVTPVAT